MSMDFPVTADASQCRFWIEPIKYFIDPFIKFGELDNRRSQRIELLFDTLIRAGVNAEIPPDIQVAMWMKFLLITVWDMISTLSAVAHFESQH